ncbi:MAG: tetratricopeptide repeat protein [Bdellovibrionota bacterium]
MACKNGILSAVICGFLVVFGGCGKDTNVNQVFKTSGEDSRIDSLLALARIHYDRGEHEKALDYAEKAYAINPQLEQAAILKSYVLLGLAGMDPFNITKKLILAKDDEAATNNLMAESTTGADALNKFSSIVNISDDDIQTYMGSFDESDNPLFSGSEYAVFVPKKPDDAEGPRAGIATISHMMEAIQTICPFVSEDAKIADYEPHNCEPANSNFTSQAKANFLWSLSHLVEALAYNAALLYEGQPDTTALADSATSTTPKTGLFKRVEVLDSQTFNENQVADYVNAVQEIKENVEAVFDVSEGSMLNTTLSDLTTVSLGFGAIAGIPSDVTDKIKKGLASIEELADKLTNGVGGQLNSKTEALKQQMTKKVSGKLKDSITKYNEKYTEEAIAAMPSDKKTQFEENKTQLCTTYKDISGYNAGNTSVALPTGC